MATQSNDASFPHLRTAPARRDILQLVERAPCFPSCHTLAPQELQPLLCCDGVHEDVPSPPPISLSVEIALQKELKAYALSTRSALEVLELVCISQPWTHGDEFRPGAGVGERLKHTQMRAASSIICLDLNKVVGAGDDLRQYLDDLELREDAVPTVPLRTLLGLVPQTLKHCLHGLGGLYRRRGATAHHPGSHGPTREAEARRRLQPYEQRSAAEESKHSGS